MSQPGALVAVVDDNESVRDGLQLVLEESDYRVLTFGSAVEFLAASPSDFIDCLVLDVVMPGMSGLELQDALRAQGRAIPIVFISGRAQPTDVARAMAGGAIDFLIKPFDAQTLLDAVSRALTLRQA